jgi:four helix bundle protein
MSPRVERFEDFIAWQKAMDLTVDVYALTRRAPFSRDFALVDQSHRAAISVASNIAEGFDRGTRAEFHRFLSIAQRFVRRALHATPSRAPFGLH